MGRINMGRVVMGGLLAGLIVNISESILNGVLFAKEMDAAMAALNRPPIDSSMIVWFILFGFVMAIVAVWLYAAIRPRFGSGPRTAAIAAVAVWLLAYLYPSTFFMAMQLFPTKLILVGTLWGLPEIVIATIAGAWLYKEA